MALNEFQTQILLLHSEQSTLDDLALGFNDRYTVHCATSGSEALTTLVETPINVIVSAQELPGMSGLEALREAKKRSPDTIGILLAGTDTSDVEALVGDEEVFQIVRGNVTGDGLQALVDNATQQMRLMALAESANDTAANVDQPVDHIVMETAKDGASLVTEQTGRLRAIKDAPGIATGPRKVAGPRTVDILVMTKDSEFFETIKDSARSAHQVHYANTLGKANDIIRNNNVGVAVIDAAMAGEKVEKLNQHLCTGANRLVSIVAGRRDDGEMLMDLINRGKVYRFLLKPVSPGRARLALEASVRHHLDSPQTGGKAPDTGVNVEPAPAALRRRTDASRNDNKVAATGKPVVAKPAEQPPATDSAVKKAEKAKTAEFTAPSKKTEKPAEERADEQAEKSLDSAEKIVALQPAEPAASGSMAESMENVFEASVAGLGYGSGSEGGTFKRPGFIAFAAMAAIALAAGAFWYFGNDAEIEVASSAPTQTEAPVDAATDNVQPAEPSVAREVEAPVTEEQVPETANTDTNAVLQGARAARDAGQIVTPIGGSALDLFGAAMSADPDNSIIAAEFEAVVDDALGLAEAAMLESRLDDAATALDRVASVSPENARLPFLFTQLTQMQQKQELDQARIAIREGRYRDAEGLLANARLLDVGDTADLDAVIDDLRSAQSKQQIDDILAKASARLDSDDLLSPASDSARYYFELALQNDPGNTAARQGLGAIASKLALKARNQIDNGDLEAAELTLASAWELDADNGDIAASNVALNAAKAAIVERQRLEEERIAAEAEARRAAEAEAEAERLAEEARLAQEASDNAVSQPDADGATNQETVDPAGAVAAAPVESPAVRKEEQQSGSGPTPAIEKAESAPVQAPTSISALTRTKYVAPKYPRSAQRRNLSGWVDVVFTVSIDGTVDDIEVRNSEPGTTFVNAAVSAIEKWEFEPVIENGVATEKRAGVRLMFALE